MKTENSSNVENMSGMFIKTTAFNGNISRWDTTAFIGNISRWDTYNITTMLYPSHDAAAFNEYLMRMYMFQDATAFKQDLRSAVFHPRRVKCYSVDHHIDIFI